MPTEALDADQRANVSVNGKPSYTINQAAQQLTRTWLSWADNPGQATTVTYAYRASAPAQMPDDTSGFHTFSQDQITATERALAAWSGVANITFVRVQDAGSAYSNNATILFGDYTSGEAGSAAFAYLPGNRDAASVTGDVWVNSSQHANIQELSNTGYGYLTLLHEIGHAIGLSHPSDYDSTDTGSQNINFAHDASYFEDSLEYSVMSYFDAVDTGSTIESDRDSPDGPLIDDIAAAQRLYGANLSTSTGNDTYGLYYSWQTIWDAGGTDTLTAANVTANQKISLKPGSFSDIGGFIGNVSIALGTNIENAIGGSGNDTIIGNDAGNRLDGGDGNDILAAGLGNDTYVGGAGADRAVLGGNTHDYHLVNGGANGLVLLGDNGSGSAWIDPTTEIVQFQNGQYLAYADLVAYVPGVADGGIDEAAPTTGFGVVSGVAGRDILHVDGNVGDFDLSRVQSNSGQQQQGDFVLTFDAHDGIIDRTQVRGVEIGEAVDQIDFRNGQYLSLHDLPAFVNGSATLYYGGDQNDLLYQDVRSPYQLLDGAGGQDDAYLNDNVWDYSARTFTGVNTSGQNFSGIELVGNNGSGALLIDSSTETVHFRDGQYLSFGDIMSYEAPSSGGPPAGVLHFASDAATTTNPVAEFMQYSGSDGVDVVFANMNAGDYTVGRNSNGSFVLANAHDSFEPSILFNETIEYVAFANGQYLAVTDLPAYMGGSETFTNGTVADDILYAGLGGDHYLIGRGGFDNAYLHGNVGDYALAAVDAVTTPNGAITGYELVADNGSGNIYVASRSRACTSRTASISRSATCRPISTAMAERAAPPARG